MKAALLTIFAATSLFAQGAPALSNTPEFQKTWKFDGKEGAVEVKLTRYANDNGAKATSLQIYSSVDATPRSVPEEAEFLASVLDDLPKAGIDIRSLDWISVRCNEPEAIKRVAASAASSRQWRDALKTGQVSVIYPVVTSFLRESHAYQEWETVFRKHGLTLRVAGVEEVLVEPFSKAGINCPSAADCNGLQVPRDAFVEMSIKSIAAP
jgi:hypothetical protein